VGRSTLARECFGLARRHGRPTLWTAATRSTRTLPFGAFAPALTRSPAQRPGLAEARAGLLSHFDGGHGVLVVDDAHLLDEASAALVHQLATEATATVVTVSTGERSPDAIVALWKDGFAERLDVRALTRADVGEMLGVVAGHTDPATVHRLWHVTDGNAMLLTELVHAGRADGRFADRHGVWRWEGPLVVDTRLRDLVAERVAALDDTTRSALHVLALGEPIGLALFEKFFPPKAVAALEDRGLVRLRRSGRRVDLRVAPPVLGETLRAGLSVTATRAIARRLLTELRAVGARRREDLPRLGALHLASGDWGDAGLLLAAARVARDDLDVGLAARLLAAVRGLGGGGHAVELLEADVLARRGDDAGAASALRRALAGAAGTGRREDAAALASIVFWSPAPQALRSPAGPREPVPPATATAAPGTVAAWTLLARATTRAAAGAWDAALTDIDAGLAVAGQAEYGGLHLRLALLDLRCRTLLHTGRPADAERLARDGFEDAVTTPLPGPAAYWATVLGRILLWRGAADEAQVRLSEAVAVLRDADFGGRLVPGLHLLAEALAATGRATEARAALAEAQAAPADTRSAGATTGDDDGGDPARPRARRDAEAELAAARAAATCGDLLRALDRCRSVAAAARDTGADAHEMFALHELARMGEARAVHVRLRELADRLGSPMYAGHAAALAASDSAALEAAAETFARPGALPLAAEACRRAAAGYAAGGHPARAATARLRAVEYLTRCPGWAAPAPDTLPAVPVLTTREREIALLAAGGSSDRDIAERLNLSVRTVQNHLYRAYAKLQTSGRRELAVLLSPR
jgi:DNA-binding CsgD family transcriptional regulator